MGTPDFAVPSLESLHNSQHDVTLVVTQPDRPKGRGQKLTASPVKECAIALGLPIHQPESVRSPEFESIIASAKADILVVVAFSILPKALFAHCKYGAINVHGSLLPKYRGAAPIQWAIAKGETITGVTIFQLDEKMDHGAILAQREVKIEFDESVSEVYEKMRFIGASVLLETLDKLEKGEIQTLPQNHTLSSPAPKLKKEDGQINWHQSGKEIHNRIRAFSMFPGCYTTLPDGKILKIRKAAWMPTEEASLKIPQFQQTPFAPGDLALDSERFPVIRCGDDFLKLLLVQTEGKAAVSGIDWINGLRDSLPSKLL